MNASPPLPNASRNWALFLDFDGTLVDIAERPDQVRVGAELRDLLQRLSAALDGALAIVSGRPVSQIDALLAPLILPCAGLHGLERRTADGMMLRSRGAGEAIARARELLAAFAVGHPGVSLEDKGLTVALHYRGAPGLEAACRQAAQDAVAADSGDIRILEGKMVVEVKPRGIDKGIAIDNFLLEKPFEGRLPVYAGDDVTDEYGFAVAERHGGVSIRVGDGSATQARYRVDDVAALAGWLERIAGDLGVGRPAFAALRNEERA